MCGKFIKTTFFAHFAQTSFFLKMRKRCTYCMVLNLHMYRNLQLHSCDFSNFKFLTVTSISQVRILKFSANQFAIFLFASVFGDPECYVATDLFLPEA